MGFATVSSESTQKNRISHTPWTSVRDVEMVSTLLWWEFSICLFRDGIAELGGGSVEGAILARPTGNRLWCFIHLRRELSTHGQTVVRDTMLHTVMFMV